MEFVLFSDTHLGIYNSSRFWVDLVISLFDEIVDTCKQKGINKAVHLGDFFHTRTALNVLALDEAFNICEKLKENGIDLYVIKGNHDQYYKNNSFPHSLRTLTYFDNIHVIDDLFLLNDKTYLVPWGYPLDQIEDESTIFGHFEINGMPINYQGTEFNSKKAFNPSDFKKFEKVFSGHFHTKSQSNNITYIGSSFAMDFNDTDAERGYYIFKDNDIAEFIEFKQAPKFKKFYADEDFDGKDVEGNICKLVFREDYGEQKNEEIKEKIASMEPLELHTDFQIKIESEIGEREEDLQTQNNHDILVEYIDKDDVPSHIKKDMLKSFVKELEQWEMK